MRVQLPIALLPCPAIQDASVLKITSPSMARTYTFSNQQWDDNREQSTTESCVFAFPGITFDPGTKSDFARTPRGGREDVARLQKQFVFDVIEPMPGPVFYILNKSGKVSVALVSSNETTARDDSRRHWVERILPEQPFVRPADCAEGLIMTHHRASLSGRGIHPEFNGVNKSL